MDNNLKMDCFIISYLKILESLRKDVRWYKKAVKNLKSRKKVYKEIIFSCDRLLSHLDKVDVLKAYNQNQNFNETLIKWCMDLNYLTAAALRYGICINVIYKNVDCMNKLVCEYFSYKTE